MQDAAQLRSLGNYRLIASLATGGMAKVYLALRAGPAGFNKLLVVKILRDDSPTGAEDGLRMFWDEARLSAQLVHPNIVHTFEVGEINQEYFLAMEYLDGQTYRSLYRRAQERGELPLAEHLRILSEIARGLHYAHELRDFGGQPLGVVHRDVSPQNVFVTYDGQVKLLDFGIAKTRDAEHKTQVGVMKGKLDYMAPEQVRGDAIDGRTDVFALGAMLYEAITGARFAGPKSVSQVTRLHARLSGSEARLRSLAPDVPEELERIVETAIALDPAQRFRDAAAFADALDGYLAVLPNKPSAKSLGAAIGKLFEAERAAMHKVIDHQVNSVQRGTFVDTTGELPALNPGEARSSSGQYLGDLDERSGSGRTPASPLATGGVSPLSPSAPKGRVALVLGAAIVAGLSLGWLQSRSAERAGAAAETTQPDSAVAAAAIALPSPTSAPSAAQPASAPSPSPEMAPSVIVEFRVSPESASLSIDDKPTPAPFSGEFPKSSVPHRIEVTAPGYQPFTRTLTFDQTRSLEIALTPLEAPAPTRRTRGGARPAHVASHTQEAPPEPTAASARPSPAPELAPGIDLAPKPRVKGNLIDMADPYAKPH